jgi:DNA gyrase/topoisomerase IV subunit A
VKHNTSVWPLDADEKLVAAISLPSTGKVLMVSDNGYGVRVPVDQIRSTSKNAAGVAGMKLAPGSKIVGAGNGEDDNIVWVASSTARAWVIAATDVPVQNRGTRGNKVVPIKKGHQAIEMLIGQAGTLYKFANNSMTQLTTGSSHVLKGEYSVGIPRDLTPVETKKS